jgi:hypothetical protein
MPFDKASKLKKINDMVNTPYVGEMDTVKANRV